MRYENDKRKVYINNYNIPIATQGALNKEQKEELDATTGIGETLNQKSSKYLDIMDFDKTWALNVNQTTSDKPNRFDFYHMMKFSTY